MSKFPKFTIVYNNGDVIHGGGEDDEIVNLQVSRKWLEAPSDGVCNIVIEDPVIGRQQLQMYEYFFHFPLNSHGKGNVGASHRISPYLHQMTDIGGLVKFGGWTDTKHFYELGAKGRKTTHVPPRTNNLPEHKEDDAE